MTTLSHERIPLGARLKVAREMAGLSQGQVAKKLELHRPSVTEIEAGRRRVSADELAQLAALYKVEVSWLLSSEKEDGPEEIRVELAARELAKLEDRDLERVMKLLTALRK